MVSLPGFFLRSFSPGGLIPSSPPREGEGGAGWVGTARSPLSFLRPKIWANGLPFYPYFRVQAPFKVPPPEGGWVKSFRASETPSRKSSLFAPPLGDLPTGFKRSLAPFDYDVAESLLTYSVTPSLLYPPFI